MSVYAGPDAARRAYAKSMATGEISKAEFEGLWGPFTKADLKEAVAAIVIEKYNSQHDERGRFSNLDHVPDSGGHRFTLGDAVKHADTGRIGMVTETHPDPKGKNHEASVLFGDKEGVFRSNVHLAMRSQRVPTSKLQVVPMHRMPKAAAERCAVFKDWAAWDAERGSTGTGRGIATSRVATRQVAPATGQQRGGLLNRIAGVLAQAGHTMAGGGNRNGFMLSGGGGGGGGSLSTRGKGGGGRGRGGGFRSRARARTSGKPVTAPLKSPKGLAGKLAPRSLHKDDAEGQSDGVSENPESVKISYRGKNAPTAIAAAHNTLHHAGIDSVQHRGPLTGPHLHVGPQSQQAAPLTYGSIGEGVAQDIQSGVKPAQAFIQALHAAGVVRDVNNPYVDIDQALVDEFVTEVQAGADPAQLAQQVINAVQNPDGQVAKGDVPGHEFHGNQWRSGSGGGKDVSIGDKLNHLQGPAHRVASRELGSKTAMTEDQIHRAVNAIHDRLHGVKKQEPSASDVHVNAMVGAINPGRMHRYVDNGSGRCKICSGPKDQGIHKGEAIDKVEITSPVWIDKAEEKKVAYGVALHPGLRDSQKDIVTEEDIADTAHRFMIRYRETGVGHVGESLPAVQVVESYLAPKEMTFIDNMGREHLVLKGSWILAHKHNDPAIWERVKKGVMSPDDPDALGSLSIQGSGLRLEE